MLLALAACNGGEETKATPTAGGDATPSPVAETPTATSSPIAGDCSPNDTVLAGGADISWEQMLPDPIPAPEGWAVRDDPGSGPFLAVFEGEDGVGSIELLQYPLEATFDTTQGIAALQGWVADFYDSISQDRLTVYGPQYGFETDEPEAAPFGGLCGLRYGFTGTEPGGTVAERFVGYATFDRTKLYLVTAFYDSATADEGIGFQDEASVRAYESSFAELVAALRVP